MLRFGAGEPAPRGPKAPSILHQKQNKRQCFFADGPLRHVASRCCRGLELAGCRRAWIRFGAQVATHVAIFPRGIPMKPNDTPHAAPTAFAQNLAKEIVDAIEARRVEAARQQASERQIPVPRLKTVYERAVAEPDRSTAILLFALVEDLMLEAFKQNLNTDIRGGWKSLVDGNGLLATANDRLSLVELLRWSRPETIADLRLMKSIRNRFAHHADVTDFSDRQILGWITSMHTREEIFLRRHPEEIRRLLPKPSPRDLYIIRAFFTVCLFMFDLSLSPIAHAERVQPKDILGGHPDRFPPNFKELMDYLTTQLVNLLSPPPANDRS